MDHLQNAIELKQDFPEETKGFDIFQAMMIWENYSEGLAAGWIIPESDNVKRVFDDFRKIYDNTRRNEESCS